MTPLNNGRNFDDLYAKLEALEEKQDGQHERVQNRLDRTDTVIEAIKYGYVSKESLGYQLANFKIVTDKLDKALDWFLWFVVAGFLGAVARIVYVNAK